MPAATAPLAAMTHEQAPLRRRCHRRRRQRPQYYHGFHLPRGRPKRRWRYRYLKRQQWATACMRSRSSSQRHPWHRQRCGRSDRLQRILRGTPHLCSAEPLAGHQRHYHRRLQQRSPLSHLRRCSVLHAWAGITTTLHPLLLLLMLLLHRHRVHPNVAAAVMLLLLVVASLRPWRERHSSGLSPARMRAALSAAARLLQPCRRRSQRHKKTPKMMMMMMMTVVATAVTIMMRSRCRLVASTLRRCRCHRTLVTAVPKVAPTSAVLPTPRPCHRVSTHPLSRLRCGVPA